MPREATSNRDAIDTVFGNMGLDPTKFDMGGGDNDDESVSSQDEGTDDQHEDDDDGGEKGEDFSSDEDDEEDDPVVSHNKGDGDDEEDEPPRQQQDQLLPRAKMDRKGNIVDKNGRVLAPAGVAARLYRKAYRAERTATHLHNSNQDLNRRLQKAIDIGTKALDDLEALEREGTGLPAAKDLGLNASEQLEALQLFHLGKTNPTELLKKVLTRATVSGIDVKSLGLQGGIDAKALAETILTEIRKDLKPVQELTAQQKRQQDDAASLEQRKQAVTEQLESFFSANPGAQRFMPIFLKVYENPQFRNMPISEAWARIQLNFMRRSQQRRSDPRNQRSRPNGRRHSGDRGGEQPQNVMADLDKSYDALLREVMAKEMPRRRG